MLLEPGTVERTATGVRYGDSAVRPLAGTGLFDLKFAYGNDTVGFDKATDFEHNDDERMSIDGEYRGGGVTGGFKIVDVEFLQGGVVKQTRRIFDSGSDGGIRRIIHAEKSMTMRQSEILAGTYDLRLKIWCLTDAGETIKYLQTGKTVTASEERDEIIANAYQKIKANPIGLVDILNQPGVTFGSDHYVPTREELIKYVGEMTNGETVQTPEIKQNNGITIAKINNKILVHAYNTYDGGHEWTEFFDFSSEKVEDQLTEYFSSK